MRLNAPPDACQEIAKTRCTLIRRRNYAPLTQGSPTKNLCGFFAGTPDLHRRCNRLLQVAARKVSAEPKVQRLLRAKCVNRVALDVTLSRHGRKCASAEFLRPRGVFSKFCSPLDYASARIILFQKDEKLVPHDRRTVLYSEWGRKARMGLPAKCTFCGAPGKEGD